MLKIVVFDGGCGGENVANYLGKELGVVEVVRAIDSRSNVYESKNLAAVCTSVERRLKPYIGDVDLIVLGGYTVSAALKHLQRKYPQQKFVGVGVNYYRIFSSTIYPRRITAMMNEKLIESELCNELRENLPYSTLAVPDFSGWEYLAKYGRLTPAVMREDLENYFELRPKSNRQIAAERTAAKKSRSILEKIASEKQQTKEEPKPALIPSDVVLLLNTCLWGVKEELEYIFGYKARVLDFRQKLLHDTCIALGLKGADGERSK